MLNRLLKIGSLWGVPIKLHWSFFLIILLILYVSLVRDLSNSQIISFILLVLILFVCVLLHELGHALGAKRVGIKANDIIISPIGGLARIESMASYPKKELFIAFCGPLVNFVLAFILFVYLYFIQGQELTFDPFTTMDFISIPALLYYLLFINTLLFAFNLIPAFPMDGGRILRALLSMKYGTIKATFIASAIGRILAVGFFILAFFTRYYVLIVMSIFIFTMAGSEYSILRRQDLEKSQIDELGNKKSRS